MAVYIAKILVSPILIFHVIYIFEIFFSASRKKGDLTEPREPLATDLVSICLLFHFVAIAIAKVSLCSTGIQSIISFLSV